MSTELVVIVQDGMLTDEQVDMLTKLAREFASLNQMPDKLKREHRRLLDSSKALVSLLEPQS